MKKYTPGTPVRSGIYVALWPPTGRFVSMDGDTLEGRADARYFRVPSILLLLASPIIGGLFVILFPVMILAAFGIALTAVVVRLLRPAADHASLLANVGWQPAEAGFNGTRKDGEAPPAAERTEDADLKKLAEQVEARRAEEKGRDPT